MTTVNEIADKVIELRTKMEAIFQAHGWPLERTMNSVQGNLPAYSFSYLFEYITYTAQRIRELSNDDLKKGGVSKYVGSIPAMIAPLQFNQMPSDPVTVINGLMMTLNMINARLPSEAKGPVKLDWESVEDKSMLPKDISRRLRAIEARLTNVEPRADEVDKKISDIEAAHAAAEQLPEDLQELAAKRAEVKEIVNDAKDLLEHIQKVASSIELQSDNSQESMRRIGGAEDKADRLIERSEQALRGATGVGLAAAFEKRRLTLSLAGVAWVVGLLCALGAALWIGSERVRTLQDLLKNDSPAHIIWMNLALTLFGVGGPIWFAWLSTKQIAVSFRLAEDYAFKGAVSRAYEGYRKEAVEIDPALQARLFSSALDRLEEAPIRLMEKENHSSPLQELLSNPAIRKGLESVPGIADKIVALIPTKGGAAVVAPVAVASAVATALADDHKSSRPAAAE